MSKGAQGQRVSMSEWNPVLIAIAFKRLDIVRYFNQELKISLKQACKDPSPHISE